MIALYYWLACALSVIGGTLYYVRTARHRPNRDSERLGLLLLYVLFGLVTAALGGLYWLSWRVFQGFTH